MFKNQRHRAYLSCYFVSTCLNFLPVLSNLYSLAEQAESLSKLKLIRFALVVQNYDGL